jgi:hypothetical protein
MPTRKMVRFSAVVLVGFACVLATEARAQEAPPPLAQALSAPLSCQASLPNETSVLVETVPGGVPSTFPHDVPCPGDTGTTCSEYNYKFTSSSGFTLLNTWLSVSSDVTIYAAYPYGSVLIGECLADKIPPNGLTSCAQREVRFNSHASPLEAKIVVSRSAPRVSTAAAFNQWSQSGFCLIQGPGAPGGSFTPYKKAAAQKLAGGKLDVLITYGPDNLPNGGACNPVQAPGITCYETTIGPGNPLILFDQEIQDFKTITSGTNTSTCLKGNPTKCYCTRTPCP